MKVFNSFGEMFNAQFGSKNAFVQNSQTFGVGADPGTAHTLGIRPGSLVKYFVLYDADDNELSGDQEYPYKLLGVCDDVLKVGRAVDDLMYEIDGELVPSKFVGLETVVGDDGVFANRPLTKDEAALVTDSINLVLEDHFSYLVYI